MPHVQLAVSPLLVVPGAYHSSVLVDGWEYFFQEDGLYRAPPHKALVSHKWSAPTVLDLGHTDRSAQELSDAMAPLFEEGSYDFIRKNCNSFSDCALFYLLGKRLDHRYRQLDLMGTDAYQRSSSLFRVATMPFYSPNQEADRFDLEEAIIGLCGLPATKGDSLDTLGSRYHSECSVCSTTADSSPSSGEESELPEEQGVQTPCGRFQDLVIPAL
jgi:hypothetical protein